MTARERAFQCLTLRGSAAGHGEDVLELVDYIEAAITAVEDETFDRCIAVVKAQCADVDVLNPIVEALRGLKSAAKQEQA